MSNHQASSTLLFPTYNISKTSVFFSALLIVTTAYFFYWGMNYTGNHYLTLFTLAVLFGIFMAFNIDGNDVANSFEKSRRYPFIQ